MSNTEAMNPISTSVSKTDLDRISWTLIRVSTGLILMPHGAQKLFGWFGGYGLQGTGQFFAENLGLAPGILFAGAVGMAEFFGGLFLALGLLTRLTAAVIVTVMAYAAFVVHFANGFFWTSGGFEFPLLWGLVALAILIRGGGEISADHRIGWKY